MSGRAVAPAMGPPLPPGGLPAPFNASPRPYFQGAPPPQQQQAPSIQAQPGGAIGAGQAAAPPAPAMVNLGYYRPSVGNARGSTWVPQGMDNPAPQIFRGPTTAWGAPNYGSGPRGSQNYYQRGSAPMGPGDWTGTGPPAGALAAQNTGGNVRGGAPNMNDAALGAQIMGGGWPFGGGGGQSAPAARPVARAPTMQRQPFSNSKFFGNPANWQYPSMPF